MKPDWATRLQRTFARKYDAGFAKGLMLGKAVGARDEQERIVKLLEERAKDFLRSEYDRWLRNEVVIFDTEGLIALIKGEK